MHFAVAHGAAEWGEAVAVEETATTIVIENRLYNLRPWYTWQDLRRLYQGGELLTSSHRCGELSPIHQFRHHHPSHPHRQHRELGQPRCVLDADRCRCPPLLRIDLVPRLQIRGAEPLLRKLIAAVRRVGLYSTAVQDAALLKHRVDRPGHPTPDSKGPHRLPATLGQPHRGETGHGRGHPVQWQSSRAQVWHRERPPHHD